MKKVVYILLPVIVYLVMHDLVQLGLFLAINYWANHTQAGLSFYLSYGQYVASAVQMLAMLLGAAILLTFLKEVPFSKSGVNNYIYAGALALVTTIGLNVVMIQSGLAKLSGTFESVSKDQTGVPIIMGVLLFGVVSPVVEEYVFRGLLYGRMKQTFPVMLSITVSALFFGIYHGNLIQGIYGFLMGLLLAWMMEWSGNLHLPIVFHALANLLSYFTGRVAGFEKIPIFVGIICVVAAGIMIAMKERKLKIEQ